MSRRKPKPTPERVLTPDETDRDKQEAARQISVMVGVVEHDRTPRRVCVGVERTDYEVAVAAYMKRVEAEYPGTMVLQPSRRLSRYVSGNWYFYNVNGFLGRIGRRQAAKLRGDR